MLTLPEKYHEQFIRVQQQYNEWTPFEQLYATIEITRTFQLSYRHFFSQLFQTNIQHENNDIFNHTVGNANAPSIIACLLKDSLDKIIFTIQLYLPLISNKTLNESLLDAYRDVLIYLDANLINPTKFSKSEQQLINCCQQILFFIQTNPNLHILLPHIPQLINLVKTNKFPIDEPPLQYHQPLQRYSSIRYQQQTSIQSLMNFSSEGSQTSSTCPPLTRYVTPHDSGVDLSESCPTNSSQHFLSSHLFASRSHSNKHSFVAKTASSPIPEHTTTTTTTTGLTHVPLKGVLSAPVSSAYSNYQQQKHRTILTKSDEEEQESQPNLFQNNTQKEDFILDQQSTNDTSKPLGQFFSFRQRPAKNNQNTEDVSQYLGVDVNTAPTRNTFIQPNTGMKDVPKWLKQLRLHKYDAFFSQKTYDEMMNLTTEDLKKVNVTVGACAKILLNIKKLKERAPLLKQVLIDIDKGQIDLQNIIQQLYEILSTPIRSKQSDNKNDTEEDLPQLIIQILEKVYQQLTPKSSSDICNNLLGLFDRCYRHEAFTDEQRHSILQRRRRLSDMLQALGKIEYRAIQSTFNNTPITRRLNKPSVRNMKSTSSVYYPNYSTPLTKYNSEPQNNNSMESNIIRRPNRSPTFVYEESNDTNNSNLHHHLAFNCMTSTPERNNGAYLANNQHQTLSRKASIDPYGENQHNNNNNNKTKLCKTFSEPSKIRFHNPTNLNNMQFASTRPPQQNSFRMISTPYSQQQQRQFLSRSPPTSTMDSSSSPIKKCYSDNGRTDYYDNNDTALSSNDIENSDDQRHNNTEYESFFHRITEHAICDDVNDSSIDLHEDISDVKPSSNNSTDTEQ